MNEPKFRFYNYAGIFWPGGPYIQDVIDFDQRRCIAVWGTEESVDDAENVVNILARHIDKLSLDVYAIKVSDDGDLLSVSSRPKDDITRVLHYPRYDPLSDIWSASDVLTRSQLTEIERLGPEVDLVRYEDDSGKSHDLVFKYALIYQHLERMWKETNIMKILSGHELIVPFYGLVIDNVQSQVLGMATSYIPGGTFADNPTRTFRFSWLEELTSVVDDLNCKFGIMHQDINTGNLVVDPTSGKIRLFDFEYAIKIGLEKQNPFFRNDIDGVILTIYEILTLDRSLRHKPLEERDKWNVEDMVEWDVKLPLEEGCGGVKGIRQFLNGWAQGRRASTTKHSHVSLPLNWPAYPPTTPTPWMYYPDSDHDDDEEPTKCFEKITFRYQAIRNGLDVIYWERPSKKSILAGMKRKFSRVSNEATGEQVEECYE